MGLIVLVLILLIIVACNNAYKRLQYQKTDYYKITKNPYSRVILNSGTNGEYDIFEALRYLDGNKRFIFNLYLPKEVGETTEVDVLMIHDSGIYVFESKNYSGWIYGSESQKMWTQVLPIGKKTSQKNHFYNPIMQNIGHIKWLKTYLHDDSLNIFSYIVFSDKCRLKNIAITTGNHIVIRRNEVWELVHNNAMGYGVRLSQDQINSLYVKLFPLTQVGLDVKQAHIQSMIKSRW